MIYNDAATQESFIKNKKKDPYSHVETSMGLFNRTPLSNGFQNFLYIINSCAVHTFS